MNYNPHFDIDYRRGLVGEQLIGTFLESLAGSRIEVKTDYRVLETGNFYVETQQRKHGGEWYSSGLAVSESDFYCFAGFGGAGFIAIRTDELKALARASKTARFESPSVENNSTMGRLVKMSDITGKIFEGTQKG